MEKTCKVPPDSSLGIVLHQFCSPAINNKSQVRSRVFCSFAIQKALEIQDKLTYAAKFKNSYSCRSEWVKVQRHMTSAHTLSGAWRPRLHKNGRVQYNSATGGIRAEKENTVTLEYSILIVMNFRSQLSSMKSASPSKWNTILRLCMKCNWNLEKESTKSSFSTDSLDPLHCPDPRADIYPYKSCGVCCYWHRGIFQTFVDASNIRQKLVQSYFYLQIDIQWSYKHIRHYKHWIIPILSSRQHCCFLQAIVNPQN